MDGVVETELEVAHRVRVIPRFGWTCDRSGAYLRSNRIVIHRTSTPGHLTLTGSNDAPSGGHVANAAARLASQSAQLVPSVTGGRTGVGRRAIAGNGGG